MNLSVKQVLRILAGSTCLTGLGTLIYANKIEARRYQLETVRVTTGGGNRNLVRYCDEESSTVRSRTERGDDNPTWRILHLSDLHLCHPESDKVEFLKKISDHDYDLVLLTGDIFENFTGIAYAQSILSRQPRLGAFAVLGNHDYYNYTIFNKTLGRLFRKFRSPREQRDVSPMVQALEKAGFQVLRNSAINLAQHGMHVIGIDWPTIEHVRLRELVGQAADDQFILILFHLPIHLDRISTAGAHLAVGGHTHGGQIRLPGLGAIITDSELPRHEASGLFFRGRTAFHISRGLGADPRSNFRLFCPPAATVIEVVHKRNDRDL